MAIKISVITVCRNSEATIADTIQSVIKQTHPDIEYIVIDGNSSDHTNDIIRKYSQHISKYISEPDKGIYDAMNKGIKMATGDVIGFLNSDDIYNDEKTLEEIASIFKDNSIEGCHGDLVYVGKTNLNRIIRYWKSREYIDGLFALGWMPAHPTFYVRNRIYSQYGGFDTSYRLAADFEITSRFMAKYKIKTRYIPKIIVRMRMGGETNKSIKNIIKQNREIYHACISNGIKVSLIKFIISKLTNRSRQFIARPKS